MLERSGLVTTISTPPSPFSILNDNDDDNRYNRDYYNNNYDDDDQDWRQQEREREEEEDSQSTGMSSFSRAVKESSILTYVHPQWMQMLPLVQDVGTRNSTWNSQTLGSWSFFLNAYADKEGTQIVFKMEKGEGGVEMVVTKPDRSNIKTVQEFYDEWKAQWKAAGEDAANLDEIRYLTDIPIEDGHLFALKHHVRQLGDMLDKTIAKQPWEYQRATDMGGKHNPMSSVKCQGYLAPPFGVGTGPHMDQDGVVGAWNIMGFGPEGSHNVIGIWEQLTMRADKWLTTHFPGMVDFRESTSTPLNRETPMYQWLPYEDAFLTQECPGYRELTMRALLPETARQEVGQISLLPPGRYHVFKKNIKVRFSVSLFLSFSFFLFFLSFVSFFCFFLLFLSFVSFFCFFLLFLFFP